MRGDLQEGHFYPSRCHLPIFPSTKSGFLCVFALRNPCFLAFQAQNRGLCALLGSGTLVFGLFEHKIGIFVRFCPSGPPFWGDSSTKSRFLCAFESETPVFGRFEHKKPKFVLGVPLSAASGRVIADIFEILPGWGRWYNGTLAGKASVMIGWIGDKLLD